MSERNDGQRSAAPIPESELLPWERVAQTPSHEPVPSPHPVVDPTPPPAKRQQPSAVAATAAAIAVLALAGGAIWGSVSLFSGPTADSTPAPSPTGAPTIVSPVDPAPAPDDTDPPVEAVKYYPLGAPNGVASIQFAYDDGDTSLGEEASFEVSNESCTRSGFLGNAAGDYADLTDDPAAVIVERFSMRGEAAVGSGGHYDALRTIELIDTNGVTVEVLLMLRTHEVDGEQQYSYYAVHPFPDSDSVLIVSESCGTEDRGEDAFIAFLTENLRLTVVSGGS